MCLWNEVLGRNACRKLGLEFVCIGRRKGPDHGQCLKVLALIANPEDGGNMFLWNVDIPDMPPENDNIN